MTPQEQTRLVNAFANMLADVVEAAILNGGSEELERLKAKGMNLTKGVIQKED